MKVSPCHFDMFILGSRLKANVTNIRTAFLSSFSSHFIRPFLALTGKPRLPVSSCILFMMSATCGIMLCILCIVYLCILCIIFVCCVFVYCIFIFFYFVYCICVLCICVVYLFIVYLLNLFMMTATCGTDWWSCCVFVYLTQHQIYLGRLFKYIM